MLSSSKTILALALPVLWLSVGACEKSAPIAEVGTLPVGNGVTLSYTVLGEGADTVLVLHGGPGLHSRYMEDAVRPLLPGRTFILYDQRGRGRSAPAPDSALTIGDDIQDLEAIRSHFKLERVSLLGHHWGSILAALYARKYPARVERMLLVSPPVARIGDLFLVATSYPHDTAQYAAYVAATGRRESRDAPVEFCRRFWGFSFTPTEVTDERTIQKLSGPMCDVPGPSLLRAAHTADLIRMSMRNFDLTDTLKALAMPVLVVQGEGPEAVLTAARAWATFPGDAREVLLPPPALFPWLGDARGFAEASRAFLGGGWPAGALDPARAAGATAATRVQGS